MSILSASTPDYIRYVNTNRVFQLVLHHQPISRTEIAGMTEISKVTVSNCIDYLLENKVLKEVGSIPTKIGRRPIQIACNENLGLLIGIETDEMNNRMIVTDFSGKILERVQLSRMLVGPSDFIRRVSVEIHRIQEQYAPKKIIGVGIALSGYYNQEEKTVEYIANRRDWLGFPLGRELETYNPGIPFFIERLANSGALGEASFGSGYSGGVAAYLHCSWGLGVGIYTETETGNGLFSTSSRFGHTTINYQGKLCSCGNRGCLEAYTSISSLLQDFYPGQPVRYENLEEMQRRYQEGDEEVISALNQTFEYLAIGIANLINAYQPQVIFIGGLINLFMGEETIQKIKARVEELVPAVFRQNLEILPATLGDDSVCYGSVVNVRNRVVSLLMGAG